MHCRGYIKTWQALSIAALCCTVLLWALLWGVSAMSAETSQRLTDKVATTADKVLGVTDKINEATGTQDIRIALPDDGDRCFWTENAYVTVEVEPATSTDCAVEYESSNPDVMRIAPDGRIGYGVPGPVTITARLKSNPDVADKLTVLYMGEDPTDPLHAERRLLQLDATTAEGTTEAQLAVGEKRGLRLNEGKTWLDEYEIQVADESVLGVSGGYVYGRAEGETQVVAILDAATGLQATLTVTVTAGQLPAIGALQAKAEGVAWHQTTYPYDHWLAIPSGANPADYDCLVSCTQGGLTVSAGGLSIRADRVGPATLEYTWMYDPAVRLQVQVDVRKQPPDKLVVSGPLTLIPNQEAAYTVKSYPINNAQDVTWSVVEGHATVDESGRLRAATYGKVVLRCQSTLDPTVYTDTEIHIKLYTNAYMFARKLMGHAGLSALLGFGLAATLLLLSKHKGAVIVSLPLAFAYAGISEWIQMAAPGRVASWNDVLVDFVGALVGIGVALVLAGIIVLIVWLTGKRNRKTWARVAGLLWIGNVWLSTDKLQYLYNYTYPVEPADCNAGALQ